MKDWSAYPIRFLLIALCEKPEKLSAKQKAAAGLAARDLFRFANSQKPHDPGLVRGAIETVCRTYDSDAVGSEELLSTLLSPGKLQESGYENLQTLAREAARLLPIAPDFVRDVYVKAFSFKERSTDQTAMGPGRILALTSNRQQDYNHSLWQLGETFPAFLRAAPAYSIEAMVAAVVHHLGGKFSQAPEQTFEFNGNTARIKTDGSYVWDRNGRYRHEPHLKMLDAFEAELHRLASDTTLTTAKDQLLLAVVQHNNLASIWRRVINCGVRNPAAFGKEIIDVARALPLLAGLETSDVVGNFIKVVYPEIPVPERERIENTILSLPIIAPADRRGAAQNIRDRLLGCIPTALMVTNEARSILIELNSQGGPPINHPPMRFEASFGGVYTDAQMLADQGVPVQSAPNRKIQELAEPLKKIAASHLNSAPALAEIEAVIAGAHALHKALLNAVSDGVHERQIENGWTHFFAFCKCAARCQELSCDTEAGRFIKQRLLDGAEHPSPEFHDRWASDFDNMPSWSPAPRIDAAEGLLFIAAKPNCMDDEIIRQIEQLSQDPVPAVRLQIADRLGALYSTAPDFRHKLIAQMAANDPSSAVIFNLLNHQIRPQAHLLALEETARVVKTIFERTDLRGEMAEKVRLYCVAICLDMFLWRDHPASEHLIKEIANDALQFTNEAAEIVGSIREILVTGPILPPDPISDKARTRAFAVFGLILSSAQSGFLSLRTRHATVPYADWPKEDGEKARSLTQLADSIATQMYFASDAFDSKTNPQEMSQNVALERKLRFLREAGALLDLLANNPHPSTVHQLIEMLKSLIDVAPREVFLRIAQIIRAGKSGGYQQESLAVGLIVDFVNRMLADFRPLLQNDQEMRQAMVLILDIFVEAGWPQAIQLTYRLDEIYR